MAALTADRETKRRDGALLAVPMAASVTIYKGSLVGEDANGRAVAATDAVSRRLLGVAYEQKVNGATAGATVIRVYRSGIFSFAAASAAQTWVGRPVYVSDDQTVALNSVAAEQVLVGIVVEYISGTEVFVDIGARAPHASEQRWGNLIFTGSATLDTGLRIVDSVQLTLRALSGDGAPSTGGRVFDYRLIPASTGMIAVAAWQATNASITTLIAGTTSVGVDWNAWGI